MFCCIHSRCGANRTLWGSVLSILLCCVVLWLAGGVSWVLWLSLALLLL